MTVGPPDLWSLWTSKRNCVCKCVFSTKEMFWRVYCCFLSLLLVSSSRPVLVVHRDMRVCMWAWMCVCYFRFISTLFVVWCSFSFTNTKQVSRQSVLSPLLERQKEGCRYRKCMCKSFDIPASYQALKQLCLAHPYAFSTARKGCNNTQYCPHHPKGTKSKLLKCSGFYF